MSIKNFIRKILLLAVFILMFMFFSDFIENNYKIAGIAFLFFTANYIIILINQRKYGQKNFIYKPYKSKKRIAERIILGFFAGVHYLFFIGSYNHKKYNTQVWEPETLECFFGNISQLIIFIVYIFIAVQISRINLYMALTFMLIPIITNIISLKRGEK